MQKGLASVGASAAEEKMRRSITAALLAAERCSWRSHGGVLSSFPPAISGDYTLGTAITTAVGSASGSFQKLPLFSFELFSTSIHGGRGGIDEAEGGEWSDDDDGGGDDGMKSKHNHAATQSVDDDDEDGWEEEEEVEAKLGDGGDGGGVVLRDVAWGERVLSLAQEVLANFDEDTVLYAFKVSPKGYIYVRLDRLTHIYGCLAVEEMERFSNLYKERLDQVGQSGEIPDNLALEVSSPGAERLLKVPEDLNRFKHMPMLVHFLEEIPNSEQQQESEKVLMLESIDSETQQCVWKLANVKENREQLGKGRPLSRKQKDWRLTLAFESIERVQLYLDA